MPRPPRLTFVLAYLLAAPVASPALTLLTAGKRGLFRSTSVLLRVDGDPAVQSPRDPTCPASSSLRFALSRRGADFEDHGEVELPCAGWQRTRAGYRYAAGPGGPGGVREVVLGRGRLLVRAGGSGYTPIVGPVAYVEAWLTVGGETHLVRLQNFRGNDERRILSRRPSRVAAAGEAAFWDTLWDDRSRADEALRLLQRAVRRDPKDGRSQFLLGMLRLYRSTIACPEFDFAHLCEAGKAEGLAGVEPLDRAIPLLENDTRIAGFAAAATYAAGYVQGDPAERARGLERIDEAVAVNPLFNSFDLFAVVAPVIPGGDPYYQERIVPLVDAIFADNPTCPATIPEICANGGMGPHNFEGSLLLLGDIYAKGGHLTKAEGLYTLAKAIGSASGYGYQAIADERVATAAERVERYLDADPANDPPLLGGGGGSCIHCHNK